MQLLRRNKALLFDIINDIICVFGVVLFNWSLLNVMLFYWLDTSLMVIFVTTLILKANKIKFHIGLIGGIAIMFGALYFLYFFIVLIGENMGYHAEKGFLMAFIPQYMIPVFLVSSFLFNFKEYKFYESKLNTKQKDNFVYPTLFAIRFFSIQGILFIGLSSGLDEFIIIPAVVVIKMLIQFWENKMERKYFLE